MEIISKWRVTEVNENTKNNLIKEGFSNLMATLLSNRGVSDLNTAEKFMNPKVSDIHSPYKMLDLDRAAKRIKEIIKEKGKILIYGHDDVDGIASAIVVSDTLTVLGIECETYFPHRLYEDYKISKRVIDYCKENHIALILTVDIGISSYEEVIYANEIGVKVIITDHHMIPPDMPPALAVVNPNRKCDPYPFSMLAGVGVAYKLAQILLSPIEHKDLLKELMTFVAVGSISDKVPLIDENRVFVSEGLKVLSESERPCWKAIKEFNQIQGYVSEDFIKAEVVPLLTAGRSTEGKHCGYDFLNCDSKETAKRILSILEKKTQQQRSKSDKVIENMMRKVVQLELDKQKLILLVDESIPISMLGLCAAQIYKRYKKPAIVIGYKSKHAVGEARAPEKFNLIGAFEHCKEYLIQFGGHKPAAGFTINYDYVGSFSKKMLKYANEMLEGEFMVPTIDAEYVLEQPMINNELAEQILKLAPFGQKNVNPIFCVKKATLTKINNGRDIYQLNGFPIIWSWKVPYEITPEDTFDIMFSFDESNNHINIKIEDIR